MRHNEHDHHRTVYTSKVEIFQFNITTKRSDKAQHTAQNGVVACHQLHLETLIIASRPVPDAGAQYATARGLQNRMASNFLLTILLSTPKVLMACLIGPNKCMHWPTPPLGKLATELTPQCQTLLLFLDLFSSTTSSSSHGSSIADLVLSWFGVFVYSLMQWIDTRYVAGCTHSTSSIYLVFSS
jgi:hypothetical protein